MLGRGKAAHVRVYLRDDYRRRGRAHAGNRPQRQGRLGHGSKAALDLLLQLPAGGVEEIDVRQDLSEQHLMVRPDPSASALHLHQRGPIIQEAGTLRNIPLGLPDDARLEMAKGLNGLLADTMMIQHLYKKHHWQVAGHTFYQLHLLFDKHSDEQLLLIDSLAERIQTLGAVAIGMPQDVVETTKIQNPPKGVEEVPVMIGRLLDAHEIIMKEARELGKRASDLNDLRTNDLIASGILATNELQVWFVGEHVVETPAVIAQ